MIVLLILSLFFSHALAQGFVPWHRPSKEELYFYNGVDGKIENGWSDDRSADVVIKHNQALSVSDGGPAEGIARLEFNSSVGDWRILTKDEGYKARPEDEIVLRIRSDQNDIFLEFHLADDNAEIFTYKFSSQPSWHQVHIPLKSLPNAITAKLAGLRNVSGGKAVVYVAYMYLKVHP